MTANGFTSSTVPATGLRAVEASVRPAFVSYSSLIKPALLIGFASAHGEQKKAPGGRARVSLEAAPPQCVPRSRRDGFDPRKQPQRALM
jgi:hypothetical protein